jgi:hypothetical protein
MGLTITAIIIAIVYFFGRTLSAAGARILADEIKAWIPWFTERFLKIAIRRLPEHQHDRFREEWRSHINEVPGEVGKLIDALGFIVAAKRISVGLRRLRSDSLSHLQNLYTFEELKRTAKYYIRPDCQSIRPDAAEGFRQAICVRERLFETMDRLLANARENRLILLLGDAGMGRTAFALNYWRRRRTQRDYDLAIVPLSHPDSDKIIEDIPFEQRPGVVLFLDSLDEDIRALADRRQRLASLLSVTSDFRAVILSCRTDFLSVDEELSCVGNPPTTRDGARVHEFCKLYLSPFTDEQVEKYLRRRLAFWKYRQRRKLKRLVAMIPDLASHPMLLTYLPELMAAGPVDYGCGIYEAMVAGWISRESHLGGTGHAQTLREFSERLAVELVCDNSDRIPEAGLQLLAARQGISLPNWQLRAGALLTRDVSGNYRFAHRSILDYLFVTGFLNGRAEGYDGPWTSLMERFLLDLISSEAVPKLGSPPRAQD